MSDPIDDAPADNLVPLPRPFYLDITSPEYRVSRSEAMRQIYGNVRPAEKP
jgi:hypothetical protein